MTTPTWCWSWPRPRWTTRTRGVTSASRRGARGLSSCSPGRGDTSATETGQSRTLRQRLNVVVVARNATGEEVHEALCGVPRAAPRTMNPASPEPSKRATPSEDAANPDDGGWRESLTTPRPAPGSRISASEHLRAPTGTQEVAHSHDADEDRTGAFHEPEPAKRLDESAKRPVPERAVANPAAVEQLASTSKVSTASRTTNWTVSTSWWWRITTSNFASSRRRFAQRRRAWPLPPEAVAHVRRRTNRAGSCTT